MNETRSHEPERFSGNSCFLRYATYIESAYLFGERVGRAERGKKRKMQHATETFATRRIISACAFSFPISIVIVSKSSPSVTRSHPRTRVTVFVRVHSYAHRGVAFLADVARSIQKKFVETNEGIESASERVWSFPRIVRSFTRRGIRLRNISRALRLVIDPECSDDLSDKDDGKIVSLLRCVQAK